MDNGLATAPPNEFLQAMTVDRVDEGKTTSFSEDVELEVNSGMILQINLLPQEKVPEKYLERRVTDVSQWGMQLVVYREGTSHTGPDVQRSGVVPLPSPKSKLSEMITINGWCSSHWGDCGWAGIKPLTRPVGKEAIAKWSKGEGLWFWTYLCAGKDNTGDFIYEIQLLPTTANLSAVRIEFGDPYVLKRGKLKVLAP